MEYAHYIDLYCERTAPGFWNEPLNAISSASFLIAAVWVGFEARRRGGLDAMETVLITVAALIGIGSFLFHTIPNGWTELADVIAIWAFIGCYMLVSIHRLSGGNIASSARIGSVAAAITAVVFWFSSDDVTTAKAASVGPFNGSLQYLAAMLALAAFAAISWWRQHPARTLVAAATLTFAVSLVFRTVDLSICSSIATGSHFLWHTLNVLMVGLLLLAFIRHMPPPERRA